MKNCKFCASDKINKIKPIKSPHNDLDYSLFECNECKSRFFDDKEYEVNIDKIYDEYPKNMQYLNIKFEKSIYWNSQKNKIIKILEKTPSSILDLGCRTGDFLMHFDENTIRDGVEIAKTYSDIGLYRGLNIYNDKLENVVFTKTYEVVSAYAILEHLTDPLKFIDKFNDLVSDEGILIILIPTHQNFKTWLIDKFSSKRWHMYSPPEHLNFFSKDFLDNYLKSKGFKLINRYWTSGGTFNPFSRIPFLGFLFKGFMFLIDESFFNKIPVFDHLYSVYRKDSQKSL